MQEHQRTIHQHNDIIKLQCIDGAITMQHAPVYNFLGK